MVIDLLVFPIHAEEISFDREAMAAAAAAVTGGGGNKEAKNYQKSYFDVLGICCPSEVPLIEKILNSMDGIISFSVIVPTKTVIVVHDTLLISQLQIVKELNQARLEAAVRVYGNGSKVKSWPSPYTLASGSLLALSFFKPIYHPMQWFAVGAVAVGIPPILLRSIAAVRKLTVDVNILMFIAVAGALALKDYWEAGTIVFLFTIAEWLESRATYKATAVMSSLMSMAPQKAILAESGIVVDVKDVEINTVLAVKAGEVIPIDGVVVEGNCEVDESSLTGESFPVTKQPQSLVWAGTLNINGYISVKTTALAEDSAVAKMTTLVEEAQNSKSRTHRMIDSCAKYYTPVVVLTSAALAVVPTAMRVHNLKHWFRLALVLLVSACPCSLVLSTPVATFCALTKAATTGLLIKGGDYLEALAKTKVVAFDKTGTITRGDFTVIDFRRNKDNICMDTLFYWVSSIESKASHPMAAALVDHAKSNSIEPRPEEVNEFKIFPGEGVYGEIDGKSIHIGNRRIATRAGCETVPNLEGEKKGLTVGYVFSGAELVGMFSLSDACRTGAAEAIKELKHLGIKTVMLTGDSNAAASYVQNQLGNAMDTIHAELLPEDKVRLVNELKSTEGATVMVGDGMNDAAALTAADVGISMGISGSAVAMETSHITLMSNNVCKIPGAIKLARKTSWKIIENIILSVITKGAILALAFSGHPLLWAAVLADVGTCLLVILNSMLLLQTSKGKGKKCCKSSHGSHRHGTVAHNGEHHEHHHAKHGHCRAEADPCHKPNGPAQSCCSHDENQCKESEAKAHGNCSSNDICDKQINHTQVDCSHTCSGQETNSEKSGHEHSVAISCGAEHHTDRGQESSSNQKVDSHDHCLHQELEEVKMHTCCRQEESDSELGGRGHERHGNGTGCSGTKCSDVPLHTGLYMIGTGGCCRSYSEECRKKGECCGNGMPHLSEIITE